MSDNHMPGRLKRAVDSQPVPVHLAGKIRGALSRGETARPARWVWPAFGAVALASVLVGVLLWPGAPPPSPDEYFAAVSAKVSNLMRVGLGDHIHCAVFRKYPRQPPAVAALRQDLGPSYAPLLDAVQSKIPPGFEVRLAHNCQFDGRRFVHLVLKDEHRLMSVIVTSRKADEALETERLAPVLVKSGVSFYQQAADTFQIAAFETPQYFVYLISDLPPERNLQTFLNMAGNLDVALSQI